MADTQPEKQERQERRREREQAAAPDLDFRKRQSELREKHKVTTLDGTVYRPKVKDNETSRTARRLGGESQEHLIRAEKLREGLAGMEPGDERKAKREEAEAAEDEGLDTLYELASVLIEDENGQSPSMAALRDVLEVEQVTILTSALLGGGEPVEGPTETESSSES